MLIPSGYISNKCLKINHLAIACDKIFDVPCIIVTNKQLIGREMHKTMLFLFGLLLAACQSNLQEINIRVDLSKEHDQGRFNPDNGDWLSIAGPFNEWEPGSIRFTDPDGDWIYEAVLQQQQLISDTLVYKFILMSNQHRDLPNSGWEVIPNRQIAVSLLQLEQPTFTFNEPWSPLITKEVTFRVNMSNQQVLGFFDPKQKDQVMVSGNFNTWDEDGILLEPVGEGLVYTVTFPIQTSVHRPLLYR